MSIIHTQDPQRYNDTYTCAHTYIDTYTEVYI